MSRDTIAALLSILVSAVATAILRYSAYKWPTGYHDRRAQRNNGATKPPEEVP